MCYTKRNDDSNSQVCWNKFFFPFPLLYRWNIINCDDFFILLPCCDVNQSLARGLDKIRWSRRWKYIIYKLWEYIKRKKISSDLFSSFLRAHHQPLDRDRCRWRPIDRGSSFNFTFYIIYIDICIIKSDVNKTDLYGLQVEGVLPPRQETTDCAQLGLWRGTNSSSLNVIYTSVGLYTESGVQLIDYQSFYKAVGCFV